MTDDAARGRWISAEDFERRQLKVMRSHLAGGGVALIECGKPKHPPMGVVTEDGLVTFSGHSSENNDGETLLDCRGCKAREPLRQLDRVRVDAWIDAARSAGQEGPYRIPVSEVASPVIFREDAGVSLAPG